MEIPAITQQLFDGQGVSTLNERDLSVRINLNLSAKHPPLEKDGHWETQCPGPDVPDLKALAVAPQQSHYPL